MAIRFPGPTSQVSLPGIDQSIQQNEFNALRNEAQGMAIDQAKKSIRKEGNYEDARFVYEIGSMYKQRLAENPNAWSESRDLLVDEWTKRGMPGAENIPAANTPIDQLMKDLDKLIQAGQDGMAGYQGKQGRIIKGADGFNYYEDGTRVNPNVQKPGPGPTTKQQDYEYGLENPDFAAAQESSSELGAGPSEYNFYKNLPSDEAREEYLTVKRGAGGISSGVESQLFESSDKAYESRGKVGRYYRLAENLIKVDPESGKIGEWTETLKGITGDEDAVTLLRKEWNQLRVSSAIQNLPPGVASDKDIELVMSAFLPDFANATAVASFMRGLAKIEELNAEYYEFKSDFLSRTQSPIGLGRAWRAKLQEVDDGLQSNLVLKDAREAIAAGRDRGAVEEELRKLGINPELL